MNILRYTDPIIREAVKQEIHSNFMCYKSWNQQSLSCGNRTFQDNKEAPKVSDLTCKEILSFFILGSHFVARLLFTDKSSSIVSCISHSKANPKIGIGHFFCVCWHTHCQSSSLLYPEDGGSKFHHKNDHFFQNTEDTTTDTTCI